MAQQIKIGEVAIVRFALYEANGTTKRGDAEGDVETVLTRNDLTSDETVTVSEIAGAAGEYVATFTPLAIGSYSLVLHDTERDTDLVETVQVRKTNLDDLGDALNFIGVPS